MHHFELHSNERACRKSGRLGLEQVLMGMKRLHRIPLIKIKLCQKSMILKKYLKVLFLLIQRSEPSIIAKNNNGMYHKGYSCGGSNIDVRLIMCKDEIFITSIIQNYVLH